VSYPVVAIIGQPNVGKSSLFNRFLKRPVAVVDESPGVTRDRNYAECDWNGRSFNLVDTGGMVPNADELMDQLIYDQTEFAITEADLVMFVVDAKVGSDHIDKGIARRLAKAGCETILVANKADNDLIEAETYEFLRLGLGDPVAVSATEGRGIGDLLDILVERLPSPEEDEGDESGAIRVAVVGRPNVGKSSFINRLTGADRLVVTPVAGTTRDAVDTPFEFQGQYILVDTAGLRRKYKVHENIEFYTTLRTGRAIESCDVAVVLVDAADNVTSQDQRILDEVISNRRAAVLVVNKWDLIEKETRTAERYTRKIKETLARFSFLPVIYISALSGQRVPKVLSLVKKVHEEAHKRVSTSELNEWLEKTVGRKHPPAREGRFIKFNYITQSEVAPPTFVIFANRPELVDRSYISYLSNQLRAEYGFSGVPIRVKFRRK